MQQCVHCFDDRADIRFGAGSANPHSPGLFGELFGKMNGNHQDGNSRTESRNLPRNVKPVQIRHLEIQQNHVRRILLYPLYCFSSRSSLVANLPGALLFEESAKIVSDRRIIVYYKNTNQTALPSAVAKISLAAFQHDHKLTTPSLAVFGCVLPSIAVAFQVSISTLSTIESQVADWQYRKPLSIQRPTRDGTHRSLACRASPGPSRNPPLRKQQVAHLHLRLVQL